MDPSLPSQSRHTILLLDDDAAIGSGLRRFLKPVCSLVVCADIASANRELSSNSAIIGCLIDKRLTREENGVAFFHALRRSYPHMRAAIYSAWIDDEETNPILAAHGQVIRKDEGALDAIRAFVHECQTAAFGLERDDVQVVQSYVFASGMSELTIPLILAAMGGVHRDGLHTALGISDRTVRTRIGAALKASALDCWEEIVIAVLRLARPSTPSV